MIQRAEDENWVWSEIKMKCSQSSWRLFLNEGQRLGYNFEPWRWHWIWLLKISKTDMDNSLIVNYFDVLAWIISYFRDKLQGCLQLCKRIRPIAYLRSTVWEGLHCAVASVAVALLLTSCVISCLAFSLSKPVSLP